MASTPSLRRPGGSVLVESLLALVVFSVGLVGLLALLAAAMLESGNASLRSEASLLAADLVARMWNGDRSSQALRRRRRLLRCLLRQLLWLRR